MLVLDLVEEHFALVLRDRSMPRRDYLSGATNVYVCGKLMDPEFISDLLGHPAACAFAVALDYTRGYREIEGKNVLFMTPEKGGVLPGVVWLDLTDEDMRRFDEFEQIPELRKKADIKVQVGDLTLDAVTFLSK